MLGAIVETATDFISETIIGIALFFDSLIFRLISYSYNLFLLTCKLNFGYLYKIVSPLVDRVKALIMVIIVFKLAMMIIKFMMNPDEAPSASKKTLVNIFKVAALLVSYNFIFNILDDISMIMLGTPSGYEFTALSKIAPNIRAQEDDGIITRFIFGSNTKLDDVGDFIAYNTLCVFMPDSKNAENAKSTCSELEKTITKNGKVYFGWLPKMKTKVGKTVEYWCFFDGLVGIYLIVCIIQAAVKVGIRMFKLMALQMLAPLAIISMIDDSKNKMGKYIGTYTSVYLEVFIRVGSMLITTVFVSKFITNIKSFFKAATDDVSGMTEGFLIIIVVVAAFKFVNDLPKFLEDSLGLKISGDGIGFGSFIKTLAGGAAGLASGIGVSAMSGNGVGRAMWDGAKGMVNGAQAGNKSQGIADFFKKQVNNTEGIAKGAKGNWIPGYQDDDGNWVEGHYARPSMLESIRDKTGFATAYRNKVERDKNMSIDKAAQQQAESDAVADENIKAEESARDTAQTQYEAAQKEQQEKIAEQQRVSQVRADEREKEKVALQGEMATAQSKMQEDQVNLKQTMENNVNQEKANIKTQEAAIKEQTAIEQRILDNMKSDDSKYTNSRGEAIKYGESASQFANNVVTNNKDIIASNAKIGRLEAELGSGHDDKGNILTDAQKAQRREELRAEISHRDELSAKITTEATNEFVNRQNIDVNANGTTVEQRKQTIIDAQTKIEEHQHNITELREQYELDKANLDVSHQAIASSYQTKANEMAERHRTETLEDRANIQKAKDDYQAPIDQAKADLDAHNKNIKAENDAKAVNKAQFDKSKKEAERLAAERLDGRYRRRPRIPRGGNHGGTI